MSNKNLIINPFGISFEIRHLPLWFFLSLLWLIPLAFLILPPKILAFEPIEFPISVSATLGEPKLTIFGYASPQALVELKGRLVDESVIADDTAYFIFDRVFLPLPFSDTSGQHYPELCLNFIDTESRLGFPVCLPPLPTGPYDLTVGPVLLSPTLSLEKGAFSPGEQVIAHGATLPNSPVTIFLANEKPSGKTPLVIKDNLTGGGLGRGTPRKGSLYGFSWGKTQDRTPRELDFRNIINFRFVRPALAYDLPTLEIKSDSEGNFEFNLPADTPATWRVFAAAKFQDSPTAKSPSLAFRVMNWWEWWLVVLQDFLASLRRLFKPLLWPLLIGAEVLVVTILWRKRSRGSIKKRQR